MSMEEEDLTNQFCELEDVAMICEDEREKIITSVSTYDLQRQSNNAE